MDDIPNAFKCNYITQELMQDPVTDNAGHTYERAAIVDWIRREGTSPVTREPLTEAELKPNYAIRDAIAEFLALRQQQQAQVDVAAAAGGPSPSGVAIHHAWAEGQLIVQLHPTEGEARTPSTLICVVDLSESMESDVVIKDAHGREANHGLCTLDLVKHSMQTVIAMMQPQDHLALVPFSSQARVAIPITVMNEAGKARAKAAVSEFLPRGTTNIWDGLRVALDLVRGMDQHQRRNVTILLFTDGFPSSSPPRGEADTLRMYIDAYGLHGVRVDAIGFGYSINSRLLCDIASAGNNGMNGFVPDGGFVGTVMVNNLSNTLATQGVRTQLLLNPLQAFGDERGNAILNDLRRMYGAHALKQVENEAAGTVSVQIGPLRHGIDRFLLLHVDVAPSDEQLRLLDLRLRYFDVTGGMEQDTRSHPTAMMPVGVVEEQLQRAQTVQLMLQCLEGLGDPSPATPAYIPQAVQLVQTRIAQLRQFLVAKRPEESPLCRGMLKELEEQVLLAISSPDTYTKWGQHYLLSLSRAHLMQTCVNFKDAGIAHYTGGLVRQLRDQMDFLFVTLPAPIPINQPYQQAYGAGGGGFAPAVDMHDYNDNNAGCFSADSHILMSDGVTRRRISALQPGQVVRTPNDDTAVIRHVVRMALHKPHVLVRLAPGIALTPWHPIRTPTGKWIFPANTTGKQGGYNEMSSDKADNVSHVYNLVLDRGHIVLAGSDSTQNPIQCVTLAHGFQEPVVQHDFFGTERVLHALRALRDESAPPGHIHVEVETCYTHDPDTGHIASIVAVNNA